MVIFQPGHLSELGGGVINMSKNPATLERFSKAGLRWRLLLPGSEEEIHEDRCFWRNLPVTRGWVKNRWVETLRGAGGFETNLVPVWGDLVPGHRLDDGFPSKDLTNLFFANNQGFFFLGASVEILQWCYTPPTNGWSWKRWRGFRVRNLWDSMWSSQPILPVQK